MANLNVLNQEELDLVRSLSSHVADPNTSREVWKKDNKILSVEEWLRSYDHSGEAGRVLYPFWKEEMKAIRPAEGGIHAVVITGSLSTGKSFFAIANWLRFLYVTSHYDSLQKALGLALTSKVIMAYLSVSATVAQESGFGEFTEMLDSIPYFKEVYPRDPNSKSIIKFPDGLNVVAGSDVLHFIGRNMISLIFDETNFVRQGGGKPGDLKKAFKIYESAITRAKTRFTNRNLRSIIFNQFVSSSTHEESFTEKLIEMSRGVEATRVIHARLFKARPEGTYSDKKFLFYFGDKYNPPVIIETKEQLQPVVTEDQFKALPAGKGQEIFDCLPIDLRDKFEMVPEDFRDECTRMPEQALQDIIGYSLAARASFFSNVIDFNYCCAKGKEYGLKHPFTREEIVIGLKDDVKIISFLNVPLLKKVIGRRPCFIHTDQSAGDEGDDSTGIALAFPIEGRKGEEAKIAVPLMLRINPPKKGDKLSISKCREFVEDLRAAGIWIKGVSYDQYQSTDSVQILTTKGFAAKNFSADRSDECWEEVKNLFFKRRLLIYDYEPLRGEWFYLHHDRVNHKVDHDSLHKKDVSDAFVSAVYQVFLTLEVKRDGSGPTSAIKDFAGRINTKESEAERLTKVLVGDYKPFDPRHPMVGGAGRAAVFSRYGKFLRKQAGEPETEEE